MRVQILPLQQADTPELVKLARAIWYAHYPSIISLGQIEYMLSARYHPDVIRSQIGSPGHWWHKLLLGNDMVAFSACELSEKTGEMKLDKLYVHHERHGKGYGSQLLAFIESLARAQHCHMVYLQVNKHNTIAIQAYKRNGYLVRESATFDIGNGFVMDDYVMEKKLAREEE